MGNAESSVSRPNGAPSIISPSSAWSAADQLRKSLEGEHTRKSGEHVRESGEHVRKSAEVDEHTPAQEQQEDFGEGHPPEESETDMPEESPVLPVQAENVDTAQAEDTPVESHHVQMRREPSSQGSIAKSESEMEKPEEPPAPPIQVEDVETRQAEDTQVEGHHVQMRREPSSQGTTAKPEEASEPQKTEEATHESIIHGTYTLVSMRANTAAMDLSGGDNKSIISFPVHGGVNQQWSIMPLAHGPERSYTIRSAVSGLYLTIEPDAGTGAVKVVGNEFPASWVVDEVTSGGGAQERVVRIGWPRSGLVVGFAEGEGETPGHKVQLVTSSEDPPAPNCLWKLIPAAIEHEPGHSADWHVSPRPHTRSSTESTVVEPVEAEQTRHAETEQTKHHTETEQKRTETVVTTTTTTTVKTTKDGTIITTVTKVSNGGGGHCRRSPSGNCVVQ